MAKSKPVGIRYDLELFDVATKEDGVTTPQQFHSLLEAIYIAHKNSLKKVPTQVNKEYLKGFVAAFVSTVEENPIAKNTDQPIKKETILISTKENPQMPVREDGEDQFDFAARKNEWKKLYGK